MHNRLELANLCCAALLFQQSVNERRNSGIQKRFLYTYKCISVYYEYLSVHLHPYSHSCGLRYIYIQYYYIINVYKLCILCHDLWSCAHWEFTVLMYVLVLLLMFSLLLNTSCLNVIVCVFIFVCLWDIYVWMCWTSCFWEKPRSTRSQFLNGSFWDWSVGKVFEKDWQKILMHQSYSF